MHEGVSDILVARARELDGVSRPMTASFVVHIGILLTLAALPSAWFAAKPTEKPMLITLGAGAIGPDPNGLTALGAKKVEEVAPPKSRPDPIIPTTPKSTAITEPVKSAVKPPPPTKPTTTPSPAPTSKPVTGAQVTPGNAVAATTAKGLGVGLSSGGQGGVSLDSNFCCPDWIKLLQERVYWNQTLGPVGEVWVEFVVERDGRISSPTLSKRSGYSILDLDALRAVSTAQLPPLPAAYEPNRLTVTLKFGYTR